MLPQSQSLTLISEGDVPESQEKSAIKALQLLLDPVWAFLNIKGACLDLSKALGVTLQQPV